MDVALPDLAVDLGDAARRAMAGAGGVDLARRAVDRPALRTDAAEPVVDRLGWPSSTSGQGSNPWRPRRRSAGEPAPWRSRTRSPPLRTAVGRNGALPGRRRGGSALGRPCRPRRTVVGRLPGRTCVRGRARASSANRTLGPFVGSLARGDTYAGVGMQRSPSSACSTAGGFSGHSKQPSVWPRSHVRDRQQFGRPWPSFKASSSTWPMQTWRCAASASWPSTRCAG